MTGVTGADADQLAWAASVFRSVGDELDHAAASVDARLGSIRWVGDAATDFVVRWNGSRLQVADAARFVRARADVLERHAAEQATASEVDPSSTRSVVPSPHRGDASGGGGSSRSSAAGTGQVPTGDGSHVATLLDAVSRFGLGTDVLEVVAAGSADLADRGSVDELIALLADPHFTEALDGVGHVVDATSAVTDLVTDFFEHPELSTDERLVHALADAATRFGVSEGAEHAAAFVVTALTNCVLPGLGIMALPTTRLLATGVGVVFDAVFDMVDDHLDLADILADRVLDVYRCAVTTVGTVVDAGAAIGELGVETVELGGDLAATAWEWHVERPAELAVDAVEQLGAAGSELWDVGSGLPGGFAREVDGWLS